MTPQDAVERLREHARWEHARVVALTANMHANIREPYLLRTQGLLDACDVIDSALTDHAYDFHAATDPRADGS